MFKCFYCDKVCGNQGSLTVHTRSCNNNPDRVPGTFSGKTHSDETKKKQAKSFKGKIPENMLDVSSRTASKILKRLNIGCSLCGWNLGSLDIHHIKHRKHGGTNEHSNLTIVCPNCHRLAHEGKIDKFVTLEEQVGDLWREQYFSHGE